MKFGRNFSQLNMHRLTELDFRKTHSDYATCSPGPRGYKFIEEAREMPTERRKCRVIWWRTLPTLMHNCDCMACMHAASLDCLA